MSYKDLQKFKINFSKKAKSLTNLAVFLALFWPALALALPDCSDPIITDNSRNPGVNCVMSNCASISSAIANPNLNCVLENCATITGNPVLTGANANCSYFNPPSGLQPCSTLAVANRNPGVNCNPLGLVLCSSLASGNRNPRINCADLIDLPLYSDIKVDVPNNHNADAGKNSVKECSAITNPSPSATPSLIVGSDYAIHNKDCIRFCDHVEAGITANNGVNCVTRKCNQVVSPNIPLPITSGGTCAMQDCRLLNPDELNDTKFQDDTKKYCNGDGIKCYEFTKDKLQFLIPRFNNTMCKLHDCPPPSASASCAPDDTLNITNQGSNYNTAYKNSICGGLSISQMCSPISCKPTVFRGYRCSPETDVDPPPSIPNPSCDQTGPNASCDDSGFCYLTIDCNLSPNQPECVGTTDDTDPTNVDDVTNAWFYRPVPMSKATDGNGNIRGHMNDDLCYTKGDLKANGWGWDGEIDMGLFTIPLGYFHSQLPPDHSRSPGACGVNKIGNRGIGYMYLCGTHGLLYHSPDPKGVYIINYGRANYERPDPQYYLKVCTRYKNTLAFDDNSDIAACGKRECAISCGFGWCSSQDCGYDKCVDLAVNESNPTECAMSNSLFSGNPSKKCLGTIDADGSAGYGGVRIRAVKYDDRICAFFDVRGHLAYDQLPYSIAGAHFFTGNEKLEDGTCISGTKDSAGKCNGFDTTDNEGATSSWRTIFTVSYIGNILPDSANHEGYYDKSGALFKAQQCAKIPLRTGPPREYNLANIDNSPRLFYPPLIIDSVKVRRGGFNAVAEPSQVYGTTDFFYPEFEVGFGTTSQLMSLGAGYTGYENGSAAEDDYSTSPAATTISTVVNSIHYNIDVFVRKEFNQETHQPLFCLYQKVIDINGSPLPPVQIVCVNRQYPEINNYQLRLINSSIPASRVVIGFDTTSSYYDPKVNIGYLIDPGSNNIDNGCSGDDNCSPKVATDPISLAANADGRTCNYGVGTLPAEEYPLCVQRDFCSKLKIECVINEIDYYNAQYNPQITDFSTFENIRSDCNQNILPLCNARKGIFAGSEATVGDDNPSGIASNPNAYGWFNEICITSGFETKLRQVVAHQIDNAVGKCIIDPASPYLTDSNNATNCDEGGKAPNCVCLTYDPEINNVTENQTSRLETPHEAGLCTDIMVPNPCPPITYNLSPNPDISDLDYVLQSINNSITNATYNNSTGVNLSHQYRSFGKAAPNPIRLAGHADFPVAFPGMNNVFGICKGFWKNAIVNNVSIAPTLSCVNNQGTVDWTSVTNNQCIRYSCEAITTSGPDLQGNYQGNYGSLESGENKGLGNAFATWPQYTKTNDFLESVNATSCIFGFKPHNSNAIISNGIITGYSGGTLPSRKCDQIGNWRRQPPAINYCERITCPALIPPTPTSVRDIAAWQAWHRSGGAAFPSANASRSNIRIQSDVNSNSYATGICNNNLGFFNSPGGRAPTLGCNYLGNWEKVINPCVTNCAAISVEAGSNDNDGHASWARVDNVAIGSSRPGVFLQCQTGYVVSGYTGVPARSCYSAQLDSGVTVNLFDPAQNSCINKCQGGAKDPVNGVTTHPSSTGTKTIIWPDTNLGEDAYMSDVENLDANHFQQGRTNGHYLLSRHCNSNNGTWSSPKILCAANQGQIGNATYNIVGQSVPSNPNSIVVAGGAVNGTCVSGYWAHNLNLDPLPSRQCSYANSANNIDEVFLQLVDNSNDCELTSCSIKSGDLYGSGSQYAVYKCTSRRITICSSFCGGFFGSCHCTTKTAASCADYCAEAPMSCAFVSCTDGACRQQSIDNTIIDQYTSGQTAPLRCRNNFGHKITGSRAIGDDTDICNAGDGNYFSTTDRTTAPPIVTCQSNGQWSAVTNDCSPCRGCTNSSDVSGETSSGLLNQSCVHKEMCLFNNATHEDWHDPDLDLDSGARCHNDGTVVKPQCSDQSCSSVDGGVPIPFDNFIMNHLEIKSSYNLYSDPGDCGSHDDGSLCATMQIKCFDGRISAKMQAHQNRYIDEAQASCDNDTYSW